MPVKQAGFTLIEMLVAIALSGILMLGALRLLPHLQRQNMQLQSQMQLRQGCLLVRWDENGNGRWEGPNDEESEWYGYRQRTERLETKRGAESCEGGGWESLSDPATLVINELTLARQGAQVVVSLSGASPLFPAVAITLHSVVNAWNQP